VARTVSADVGVDDARGAVLLAALGEFNGVHRGGFFPAFDGNFALARVDADDDLAGKLFK